METLARNGFKHPRKGNKLHGLLWKWEEKLDFVRCLLAFGCYLTFFYKKARDRTRTLTLFRMGTKLIDLVVEIWYSSPITILVSKSWEIACKFNFTAGFVWERPFSVTVLLNKRKCLKMMFAFFFLWENLISQNTHFSNFKIIDLCTYCSRVRQLNIIYLEET